MTHLRYPFFQVYCKDDGRVITEVSTLKVALRLIEEYTHLFKRDYWYREVKEETNEDVSANLPRC